MLYTDPHKHLLLEQFVPLKGQKIITQASLCNFFKVLSLTTALALTPVSHPHTQTINCPLFLFKAPTDLQKKFNLMCLIVVFAALIISADYHHHNDDPQVQTRHYG